MHKILTLMPGIIFTASLSGQENISDCIKNAFIHADSVDKLGKNPLLAWKECVLGKQIPEINATTMIGDSIQIEKLKGKIVLINLWFIECHPCIAEMPAINQLAEEYKNKDVVILAITYETKQRVQNDFLKKYKLDCLIIPDARNIINKIGGSGYPTTFIVNRNGIIKEVWSGGRTDGQAVKEYYAKAKPIIDELLILQ